ncbi:MAG: cytochrome b/b6 domain-containing protein [Rhodobacteraceae bacterium]|nr:cytochrome b/b6 domain-containing protein [Paracoccaceae bacterium]
MSAVKPAPRGYSRIQIILHWVVTVLIVSQIVFQGAMSKAWDAFKDGAQIAFNPLVAAHVFGGLAILVFAVWRLSLRYTRGVPAAPEGSAIGNMVGSLVHFGLYALMIVMPVSGAVAWFGGVTQAAETHSSLKFLVIVLVVVHVAAALLHQFVLKDNLLMRMKQPAD